MIFYSCFVWLMDLKVFGFGLIIKVSIVHSVPLNCIIDQFDGLDGVLFFFISS